MNAEGLEKVIQEIKEGNYLLYEEIVIAYQNKLMAFICRIVKDEDDAKDLCQDTFFKAYRSIKSFRGRSKFSTWLFRIGYHNALNFIKKKGRELRESDSLPPFQPHVLTHPAREIEMQEMNKMVHSIMETIPAPHGAALHLYFKEGLDYKEIAEVMAVPINTVKSHIHRGKQIIRRTISKRCSSGHPSE